MMKNLEKSLKIRRLEYLLPFKFPVLKYSDTFVKGKKVLTEYMFYWKGSCIFKKSFQIAYFAQI